MIRSSEVQLRLAKAIRDAVVCCARCEGVPRREGWRWPPLATNSRSNYLFDTSDKQDVCAAVMIRQRAFLKSSLQQSVFELGRLRGKDWNIIVVLIGVIRVYCRAIMTFSVSRHLCLFASSLIFCFQNYLMQNVFFLFLLPFYLFYLSHFRSLTLPTSVLLERLIKPIKTGGKKDENKPCENTSSTPRNSQGSITILSSVFLVYLLPSETKSTNIFSRSFFSCRAIFLCTLKK